MAFVRPHFEQQTLSFVVVMVVVMAGFPREILRGRYDEPDSPKLVLPKPGGLKLTRRHVR